VGTGPTAAWVSRCIPYAIRAGSTLAAPAERALVEASFAAWTQSPCTDLEFKDMGPLDVAMPGPPGSGQPNVVFPLESRGDQLTIPSTDIALTYTYYSTATGEIQKADIVLNMISFRFGNLSSTATCSSGSNVVDLRTVLVREIAHVLGFDAADPSDPDSVLSTSACIKRAPSAGDEAGVCFVYPKGLPTHACNPPPDGYGTDPNRLTCPGESPDAATHPADAALSDSAPSASADVGTLATAPSRCGCTSTRSNRSPGEATAWLLCGLVHKNVRRLRKRRCDGSRP
jgi:hypothetical protein